MNRIAIKIRFVAFACIVLLLIGAGCGTQEAPQSGTDITSSSTITAITYTELSAYEADQMIPNAYDLEMAIEKDLAYRRIYDKNYLEVRAAYLALLNYYLCQNAGLDDYQAQMDDSDYNFIEYTSSYQGVYKTAGAFGRANIYIRNNVYVERLSTEDLALLLQSMDNGSVALSDPLLEMVKNTMVEVIAVIYDNPDAEFEAVYDGSLTAPNRALVLSISYYPEFDEDGELISRETEHEKRAYVANLAEQIESEMGEKLGIDVRVFIYY